MTLHCLESRQEGGHHYKTYAIQPAEYNLRNDLPWAEGDAIAYITRHREKGGAIDLLKAKHFIDMILEVTYGLDPTGKPFPPTPTTEASTT